jgi:hypothetical protein
LKSQSGHPVRCLLLFSDEMVENFHSCRRSETGRYLIDLICHFAPFVIATRVARWYIFKPKIPIWVNFGESCYGIYYMAIWSVLWPFDICVIPIWYIFGHYFFRVGMLYLEKSGNPDRNLPHRVTRLAEFSPIRQSLILGILLLQTWTECLGSFFPFFLFSC